MTPLSTSPAAVLARLWRSDRALVAVGLLMLGLLAAFGVGLLVDPRTVTGMPVWLKPAKFAVSIAIYSFTLAWLFTFIPEWRRTTTWVGRTSAIVFLLEVAIIGAQAWRGTTSHFNVATPINAVLFAVMGAAIVTQTLASVFVAVALWRTRIDDRAMGAAVRAGMIITILCAASA
jgi:fucose 4-O-acetylase-like acetyltransferase